MTTPSMSRRRFLGLAGAGAAAAALPDCSAQRPVDLPGPLPAPPAAHPNVLFVFDDQLLIGNYTSDWDFLQTGTSWPEWRGVRTKQYTYCRWLTDQEELYDNLADPYQMTNLAAAGAEPSLLAKLRARLSDLLATADDDFRPGPGYGEWYDEQRNLVRTGLGPVGG